jgi:hypothetical protein
MANNQIDFLYQSITDAQNTIRAIDTKLGFILILILLPISATPKIYDVYGTIKLLAIYNLLSFLILILWILAVILLYKALMPIEISSVKKDKSCHSFYNSDIYKLTLRRLFCDYNVKPLKTIDYKINCLPKEKNEIISALMHETYKLTYIRDAKILRSKWCIRFTLSFILLGTTIWTLSVLKVGL